jgi:hypothetical protein
MLSKILIIIGSWLAIAGFTLLVIQAKNNAEVTQTWQALQPKAFSTERFSKEMIANQPEPVQRYFLHAIAPGTPLATSAHLTMNGNIRLAPNQAWMPFQAEERLTTNGFVWKATAGQGMMQMRGADYYLNREGCEEGRMRFSLWGLIPVVNAHNPDVMRSAIGRLAGEWFWLPSVLLPSRGVSWQVIDHNTIQASLQVNHEPVALTFVIDDRGRLLKSSLLRWGDQTDDKHYAEIPFGGEYQAEQTFGGYTIPSQMGAGWWIGTARYFEFIRTTIQHVEFH